MLLTLALSFCLFSCTGGGDCEHEDADGDDVCDICGEELGSSTGDAVALIKNGELKFQIVRGYDLPVAAVMYIDKIADMLADDFDIELLIVEDKESTLSECEVLLGTVTSRGDEYKYDKHQLGYEGYTIQSLDSKIIVSAGSDDLLTQSVKDFFEDILGISLDSEEISDVSFTKEMEVFKPQSNYRINDVTVGGESIKGAKIVVDASYSTKFRTPLNDGAKKLQDFFYKEVGIWLDIVSIDDFDNNGNAIYLRGVEKGKAGSNGFQVKLDGKSLVIECAHHNKFEDAFQSYYSKKLDFSRTEVLALKEYDSDINITMVKYSDFGAVGDGKTDDYEAIKKTHEFANEGGQTVYGDNGKTYYLNNIPAAIPIKTDVNWNGAKIIIDDSNVTTSAGSQSVTGVKNILVSQGVFVLEQDTEDFKATAEQLAAVNALKNAETGLVLVGLESRTGETTSNIGFALGYPAMLTVYNKNNTNYLRYGYVDTKGSTQHEIILVDEDGNIDPSTPILHDYTDVSQIVIHRADTKPVTISNGTVESIASRINLLGGYQSISRGIDIKRANVTIKNLTHIISGEIGKNQPVRVDENGLSVIAEGYSYSGGKIVDKNGKTYTGNDIKPFTGHSYGGFVAIRNTTNTLIEGVTFQARVYYEEGTYDISAGTSNNLVFKNCNQSNFFEEDGVTVNMSKCWGVAGTNYCKNMDYINCNLTRYDAHAGVTNGKIIGGSLAVLRLIGGGEFLVEDVTVYARNSGAPFQLRSDYGASFNGTLTIKNCSIVGKSLNSLISAPCSYWDMGYKTFFPNIVIDGLTADAAKDGKILLIEDRAEKYVTYGYDYYPGCELFRVDPSDPNTAGFQFCYTTKTPDAWIKANITDEGTRFNGCEYKVYDHKDGTATVVVTDNKNQYPYHAPDFIEIKNIENKGYKFVLYNGDFFKNTRIDADSKSLELVPKNKIPSN